MDGQHEYRLHELGRNSHLSCEIVRKKAGGSRAATSSRRSLMRHQSDFGGSTAGSHQPRSRLVQRAATKLQQAERCFLE
jgi:hypothetical protein